MTAKQVLLMIEARHTNDVFVPECKDGATQFGPHMRLDAWAMKRSWMHPLTTGYEIKISRADFLRDTKLPAYLDLCNQLYLVCAPEVCMIEEIPEQCGLMVPSKTGSRLFIKRKAPFREIEEPAELYKYVLMSRAVISAHAVWNGADVNLRFWRKWLEHRELDFNLGQRVGKALREEIKTHVTAAEQENERLQKEIEQLREVREMVSNAGIDSGTFGYGLRSKVRDRIQEIESGMSHKFDHALDRAITSAERLQKDAGRLRELFRDV